MSDLFSTRPDGFVQQLQPDRWQRICAVCGEHGTGPTRLVVFTAQVRHLQDEHDQKVRDGGSIATVPAH
jgi:hypothetical protein